MKSMQINSENSFNITQFYRITIGTSIDWRATTKEKVSEREGDRKEIALF